MKRIRRFTAQLAVAAVAIALIPGTTGAEPAWAGPESSRVTAQLAKLLDTDIPDTTGKALAGKSATELVELGRKQFETLVEKGGDFSGLSGVGEKSGNVFVALPATRKELNDFVHNAKFGELKGLEALDAAEALQWVKDVAAAFTSDLSSLDKAAVFAGQVPVLAEALGLASTIVNGGDDIDIAQNVVALLTNTAGFTVSLVSPVVGIIIVLVGALIGAFVAAFKDTSPIQAETMQSIRDTRFQEWLPSHLPELTEKMAAAAGDMFAAWQATEVFNFGIVDAALDRAALAAEASDPNAGAAVVAKAFFEKVRAYDALQAKLAEDRDVFIAQSKDGFVSAIAKAISDPDMVTSITDQVFPLSSTSIGSVVYGDSSRDGRLGSDSNWATLFPEGEDATWPWAAADGSVTGGWEMFAADARAVQTKKFPTIAHDQPFCNDSSQDAAFYAAQSVDWLNQNCYATLTRMAERYGSIVTGLRTTPLPAVDQAQLETMFAEHLNDPEVQADLTVMRLPNVRVSGS